MRVTGQMVRICLGVLLGRGRRVIGGVVGTPPRTPTFSIGRQRRCRQPAVAYRPRSPAFFSCFGRAGARVEFTIWAISFDERWRACRRAEAFRISDARDLHE